METKIPFDDLLTALQLRVAKRADEISARKPARTSLDLASWLEAEQELVVRSVEALFRDTGSQSPET